VVVGYSHVWEFRWLDASVGSLLLLFFLQVPQAMFACPYAAPSTKDEVLLEWLVQRTGQNVQQGAPGFVGKDASDLGVDWKKGCHMYGNWAKKTFRSMADIYYKLHCQGVPAKAFSRILRIPMYEIER
jgi:hypothetical protein